MTSMDASAAGQPANADDDRTVHVLLGGRPLCGFMPDVYPGDWPDGHVWVRWADWGDATCDYCRVVAKGPRG